jgi:hypothetical protein
VRLTRDARRRAITFRNPPVPRIVLEPGAGFGGVAERSQ